MHLPQPSLLCCSHVIYVMCTLFFGSRSLNKDAGKDALSPLPTSTVVQASQEGCCSLCCLLYSCQCSLELSSSACFCNLHYCTFLPYTPVPWAARKLMELYRFTGPFLLLSVLVHGPTHLPSYTIYGPTLLLSPHGVYCP